MPSLSTTQDLQRILNPDLSIGKQSEFDKVYVTSTDDLYTANLLQTYSRGRIVGIIPSRPATTVIEFTTNIVEFCKYPPPAVSISHPCLPIAGATIATQNTHAAPHEIMPSPPSPILKTIPSISQKDHHKKGQNEHLGVPRFGKVATPLNNVISMLNSTNISKPLMSRGGDVLRGDFLLDKSVDWESVVKKLHKSIEEEALISHHQDKDCNHVQEFDSILPSETNDFEHKQEYSTLPEPLSMIGLKMKKVDPIDSRPHTQVSVSTPTRPPYKHFHTIKPAIPITSRKATFDSSRMGTSRTDESHLSRRVKLVSIKDRKFIEQLETLPIASLMRVTGQYQYHQLQNRRIRAAQDRVTGAKINDSLSKMIIRDRRNARFPEFVNPVGYPNVPQEKKPSYWIK